MSSPAARTRDVAYAVWDRLVAPPAGGPGFIREPAYLWGAPPLHDDRLRQAPERSEDHRRLSWQNQTIGHQVVNRWTGVRYGFFELIQNASDRQGHRGESASVSLRDGGLGGGRD